MDVLVDKFAFILGPCSMLTIRNSLFVAEIPLLEAPRRMVFYPDLGQPLLIMMAQ